MFCILTHTSIDYHCATPLPLSFAFVLPHMCRISSHCYCNSTAVTAPHTAVLSFRAPYHLHARRIVVSLGEACTHAGGRSRFRCYLVICIGVRVCVFTSESHCSCNQLLLCSHALLQLGFVCQPTTLICSIRIIDRQSKYHRDPPCRTQANIACPLHCSLYLLHL